MTPTNWQPSASIETLKERSRLFTDIRKFFAERCVMEVDVPVLSRFAVSDPFIDSMNVLYRHFAEESSTDYFLQSSPEYAMKRLLAANSGCIYQMSKVFRNGEVGRKHNPEFTMLEWYRIGFDEVSLMEEVAELVFLITGIESVQKLTYQQAFLQTLDVDIFEATTQDLAAVMRTHVEIEGEFDRDGWLNLLMSHCVEPNLKGAVFVYDYPATQAALSKIKRNTQGQYVAARFELFVDGVELANGYHELTDAKEQKRRFAEDVAKRSELGLPKREIDERLVSALKSGVPECAGVALGVDRLIMLALQKQHISEVLPFDFSRA